MVVDIANLNGFRKLILLDELRPTLELTLMTVSFLSGADPRPHASYTQTPASGCDKVISERSASPTDEAVYSTCADSIEKADTETVIFLEELCLVSSGLYQ
jgi:hypothetical protein